MRLALLSDTHNYLPNLVKHRDKFDILVHAGDMTGNGQSHEWLNFLNWLLALEKKVVFIVGNHELGFDNMNAAEVQHIIDTYAHLKYEKHDVTYLLDSAYEYELNGERIQFYGSPHQPWFNDWAFNFPKNDGGKRARKTWAKIPVDTDVLITHGPPFGILDTIKPNTQHLGCPYLLQRIEQLTNLRCHIYGHIHGSAGYSTHRGVLFANAAYLDERYSPNHKGVMIIDTQDYQRGPIDVLDC